MAGTTELLQGTLDLLILKAVSLGPLHGYGVLLRIQQISHDKLRIQQGSLYPALYRLEHQGLIACAWGESENNRRAKYYRLTAAGRRRLQQELDYWHRLSEAIGLVLAAVTPGPTRSCKWGCHATMRRVARERSSATRFDGRKAGARHAASDGSTR
jgi:transcriptional regulator